MDKYNLERHYLSGVFPDYTATEIDDLEESVRSEGFSSPTIWLLDGQVLDGWHRYRIARRMSRIDDLDFLDYEGDNPVGFVISLNITRRHLSASDLGMGWSQVVVLVNSGR